jgi:uncharacterized cupin superfamily protein
MRYTPIASADVPWEEAREGTRFVTRWRHLTRAAAGEDYSVGVAIEELAPGRQSAPAHYHIFEEEHVYILEGTLTLRYGAARYAMKPGDYACFTAGLKAGHCLVNEGEAPCRYVVLGERNPNEVAVYTDSNKVLVRALGRSTVLDLAARRGYWDGEETGAPYAAPAPADIASDPPLPPVAEADVPWEGSYESTRFGGQAKHLSFAAVGRAYHVGVMFEAPAPGKRLAPLHYHMLEEEQALVLEGELTLLLGEERHPMKPGDYVYFPAGRKVGHSFMNSGTGPCRYLMIGERNPNDVCVYPDSNKVMVAALRSEHDIFDMAAVRRYWDGE